MLWKKGGELFNKLEMYDRIQNKSRAVVVRIPLKVCHSPGFRNVIMSLRNVRSSRFSKGFVC